MENPYSAPYIAVTPMYGICGGGSVSDYATTRELVQLQKQFMLVWCQKIMAG